MDLLGPYTGKIVALEAPSYYFTANAKLSVFPDTKGAYLWDDSSGTYAYIIPSSISRDMYVHFLEEPGAVAGNTLIREDTIKSHGPLTVRVASEAEISYISSVVKKSLANFGVFPDPNGVIRDLNMRLFLS